MSELSEILKNEYKKKEEQKPIDFSMLMEMVENELSSFVPKKTPSEKDLRKLNLDAIFLLLFERPF